MNTTRSVLSSFLFLLSSSLCAQSLTITPGGVVTAGTNVTLSYSNPHLAGQTIVVTIAGGIPQATVSIEIQLDDEGEGTGTWGVPTNWRKAYVNAPDVTEQIIVIA
jgi:hypothetical protein